jgi:hypothetical protein
MADLTKEQVLAVALDDYRKKLPLSDNEAPKTDWIKLSKGLLGDTSQTKVLCKDGTFGYDLSSSNARYDNSKTCINNGGRAENQPVVVNTEVYAKKNISPEEKFYESLGIKSRGGWSPTVKAKGRFYLAVVLVAGYFAYKKFKK